MSLRLWQIVPDLATVDALAEPWQKLYAHSTVVATLVLFGHVGGLIVAGALTFSMESGALRLDPADEGERQRYLGAVSRVFWTKMFFVVLLLANAFIASRLDARLRRTDDAAMERHDSLWRRRRASAWATAVLWFALVLSGSALASR